LGASLPGVPHPIPLPWRAEGTRIEPAALHCLAPLRCDDPDKFPLPARRGNRIRDNSPPPPLWGRAFGVGVAGSEATETPTPEGRGVPPGSWLTPCQCGGADDCRRLRPPGARIGNVSHRLEAGYPPPPFFY